MEKEQTKLKVTTIGYRCDERNISIIYKEFCDHILQNNELLTNARSSQQYNEKDILS